MHARFVLAATEKGISPISFFLREICAGLGRKHDYRFNCSSNFAESQFPRLWADVAWHQRVTGIIRGR